jgi:DNA-binding response OmpR family regulator
MKPQRIILADPDARLLATHHSFLAQHGYEVAVCSDALACLELLRSFRPDLLVLNPDLPWGQGEGVLCLMRDGDAPTVPVVLVSDRPGPQRRFPVGRFPIRSFLPKPVAPDRLANSIRWAFGIETGPPSEAARPVGPRRGD